MTEFRIQYHRAGTMADRAMNSPLGGAFVEVGVWKGHSAVPLAHAAMQQNRPCYLYDTFEGMPYANPDMGDTHKVGDFMDTSSEAVAKLIPYATIIKGIFPQSAIEMGPIAFVHLDVDQYQSYKEALEYFHPRMMRDGVIWLDDATLLEGARRATVEFCQRTGVRMFADRIFLSF